MPTIATKKKPVRKPATRRSGSKNSTGVVISPITGLAVLATRPGPSLTAREYAALAKHAL